MYADSFADRLRPLKSRVINQQGTNFTRTTTDFDAFGWSESDSVSGTANRTESTEYYHDLPKWVVGQVARQLVNGTEVSKIDYNASALPWRTYSYGLQTQTLTYDSFGALASITDGRGNATTLSNWKFGIPQSIGFPGSQSIAATVDSRGWITQVTDELGYSTSYGYDLMGRVSSITYPTGDSTAWTPVSISFQPSSSIAYGLPVGHWVQVTTKGSFRKEVHFDGLWRPVIQVESDTGVSGTARFNGWKYDDAGRVTFAGYPRASATGIASFTAGTTTTYDALGRPVSVSQSTELGNAVTQYSYLTGFKTRVRNPRNYNTDTTFQAFGEPATDAPLTIRAAVGSPEEQLTTIARNAFGSTTRVTRSGTYAGASVSASRDYVYDAYQRLCKRIEPETGATIVDYDQAGNVAWTAEGSSLTSLACDRASVPASERVARTYDARNRLTLVNYPDATSDTTTTYFADGAIQSVSTGGVTTTYSYNKRRMLASEQLQHGSINWLVQYNYSALGHLGSIVYPNGQSVAFSPNALGQATQAGSYASGATYWPNGALKQFTFANGIVHTLTQNSRLLPSRSKDALGSAVAVDYGYDYDFNGNIAGITDYVAGSPVGDRDMTYDAIDRLTGVAAGSVYGGQESFAYDPLDNLRVAILGSREHRYNYNAKWQLETIKNPSGATLRSLLHDVRGNVTQRNSGDSFVFDRANRLTSSSLGTSSYLYDGLGRRVRRVAAGSTSYYLYNKNGELLYGQVGTPSNLEAYVYLAGSIVAKTSTPAAGGSTAIRYQHTDGLGSVIAESVAGPQIYPLEKYTAYGEVVDGVQSEGHGYTGHQSDPAGNVVYMQQRYYDPVIGRFLSADPVAVDVENGDNFNGYQYARNNPFRNLDPDGRYTCESNDAADCAELRRIVDALKRSARKQRMRNRSALRDLLTTDERDRLAEIVEYIGDENDGAGPTISFADLPEDSLARTNQNGSWAVDIKKIRGRKDSVLDGAMAIAHEGQHDVDRKNRGPATTESEVRVREDRAYRIQSAVARSRGAIELSESHIKIATEGSVAKWKERQKMENEK
jgi:RHS repeat-associated protein